MKAFAIDIDGTIFTNGNLIEPATINAIKKLSLNGIIPILISARPYEAIVELYNALDLKSPFVCLDGAIIYSEFGSEIILEHTISQGILKSVGKIIEKFDPEFNAYVRSGSRYSATSKNNPAVKRFIELSNNHPERIDIFENLLENVDKVHKIGIMLKAEANNCINTLNEKYSNDLSISINDPSFIGILSQKANKKKSLEFLSEYLGINSMDFFAIGDSYNDIDMIKWAGFGIAMGNAKEEVKSVSKFATKDVKEKGFAFAVNTILQNRDNRFVDKKLRYGMNPDITKSFLVYNNNSGLIPPYNFANLEFLTDSRILSYNNILDIDSTIRIISEFASHPTVLCTKHTNPAIAANSDEPLHAIEKIINSDNDGIFGSLLATNFHIDSKIQNLLKELFLTAIIAPSFDSSCIDYFKDNTKIILVQTPKDFSYNSNYSFEERSIAGAKLIQSYKKLYDEELKLKFINCSSKDFTEKEFKENIIWGLTIIKYAKTNAVAIIKDGKTLAISNAEITRFWAVDTAVRHCNQESLNGSLLISDGRFTHEDAFQKAATSGINTIVAPKGIIQENILRDWANKYTIKLILTSKRLLYS
ncbi:MAG: Cof-type HAD-IIB family hydrolase [Ignavibacteriales bacterium]|nr:Cof-type HAD-IIB family hydrolase [Ignavibacteriales bacterium]